MYTHAEVNPLGDWTGGSCVDTGAVNRKLGSDMGAFKMSTAQMKTTNEMQLVPVEKLVPYINNARTHSPEQILKLRASLREFGFVNPIIIDRKYNVLAGHGRLEGAKAEGYTEVPCVFVDEMTEAQKKAYILADNRMAMDAGWDEELLRVEIEALQADAFDVSLTGFDEQEIADLFKGENETGAEDDDFDLNAALEKASFVKYGAQDGTVRMAKQSDFDAF